MGRICLPSLAYLEVMPEQAPDISKVVVSLGDGHRWVTCPGKVFVCLYYQQSLWLLAQALATKVRIDESSNIQLR